MDVVFQLVQGLVALIVIVVVMILIPFLFMLVFSFAYGNPPPPAVRQQAAPTMSDQELQASNDSEAEVDEERRHAISA